MFQSYALFPHMSVRANVAYGLEMERLPRAEIRRARRRDPGDDASSSDLADRKPEQLSGGQRQRVALARALVKRPAPAAARRAASARSTRSCAAPCSSN